MCLYKGLQTELCKEFARKNHNLYIDNFCNSFPLMLTLKHNGFLACGTAIEKFKVDKTRRICLETDR